MAKRVKKIWSTCLIIVGGLIIFSLEAVAADVYSSPYVSFSPDGRAFTTNAFEAEGIWYEEGTTVNTGIHSTLREPKTGEHLYRIRKQQQVAVGSWVVVHKYSSCCHNSYPPEGVPYHGLEFRRKCCLQPYYSGWMANCADCGESITAILMYMSRSAAETLGQLDLSLDYYYLCPHCRNLEQGSGFGVHYCKALSWNRYQVRYDNNCEEWVGGYMEHSLHMYNNETVFEGEEVIPQTHLSPNTYTRIGYRFKGWNTKPDGSGVSYPDQAEIWNLTTENYDRSGGGTVTLYAQWEAAESILQIDPSGGSYCDNTGIVSVRGVYGSSRKLEMSDLRAPKGYRVAFQTNGGTPVETITGTTSFAEWMLVQPFQGKFREDTYYFLAPSGNVDMVRAVYEMEPVRLPEAQKEGSSFGGWYYDEACTMPAGAAGDELIPQSDTVLYAKWVDLVLKSEDNYAANGGKGAVDLAWNQKDGNEKTYQLYQSQDQINWTLVSGAEDISNSRSVNRTFSYSGATRTYTVPYSGLYTISVNGAQGGDYGTNSGGKGGSITGSIWLTKGEKLTYTIGGQNGFGEGGKASVFANGGGYTRVDSNLKGTLLIAGGGGGATSLSAGGAGGAQTGIRNSTGKGEEGASGGGGGYRGGLAGEVIYHYHEDDCFLTEDTSYVVMSQPDEYGSWANGYANLDYDYNVFGPNFGYRDNVWGVYTHGNGENSTMLMIGNTKTNGKQLIPVNGNQKLNLHLSSYAWGKGGIVNGALSVYDQKDNLIFTKELGSVTRYTDVDESDQDSIDQFERRFEVRTGGKKGNSSGWYRFFANVAGGYIDKSSIYWNETIDLPAGTSGVRICLWTDFGSNSSWISSDIHEISFSGMRKIQICPYAVNGQLVSAKAAYGGSNYVNTAYVKNYHAETGKHSGDGNMQIQSVSIGYLDSLSLYGITATDHIAPEKIDEVSMKKVALTDDELRLEWAEPRDHGSRYYHKVHSFLKGSTQVLSRSNITLNELVTGVAGYYCLVDSREDTAVNSVNGEYAGKAQKQIVLTKKKQYFHVAAVDKAGNIGETLHLEIGKADEEVAWPLMTDRIQITSEQGVYEKSPGFYYVRCDGETPFLVQVQGYITGIASAKYQTNHIQLEMTEKNGEPAIMDIMVPRTTEITDREYVIPTAQITKQLSGPTDLTDDLYTVVRRCDRCRRLLLEQRFVMQPQRNGKILRVIPRAGADFDDDLILSDRSKDVDNSVLLVGDNEAPVVKGAEALENYLLQEEAEHERSFVLEAEDTGSGLSEFYAVIINQDNGGAGKYEAEDGRLCLIFSDENKLFQGNFTVELHAADNVGNKTVLSFVREYFSVSAYIERILEPKEPMFKGGESGRISMIAQGYVDRVEIIWPEEFVDDLSEQKKVYEYGGSGYRQEAEESFMVPLYVPAGEYQIVVNAWKDGELKSSYPLLWTYGKEENVLKEIRTRLR